jgi:hypothetical protein
MKAATQEGLMAETFKEKLARWTDIAVAAKTFVIALVALVAALAALGSGFVYLNKVLNQIGVNREQTKASATILASNIDTVNKTAKQNHDDIVALNAYLVTLNEGQLDQALAPSASASRPLPPPIWPRLSRDAGVAAPPPASAGMPPLPYVASSAPPMATQEGNTKRRPPPQPGPPPPQIDPTKATDVFKP